MKALRIAHIDTERTWRGGEQQAFSLMEGLKSRGHYNLLISHRDSVLSERARGHFSMMEVAPWGEWDFVAAHFLNRRIKSERIDVIHAHTGHGVSLAVLASMGTRIPVVITRRVDFPLSQNLFSQWKYARVQQVVAISDGVKKVLLSSGIPDKKITVVHSGVDFNRYLSIHPLSKKDLGVPEDCYVIGQVAALAPHKDQNNLLEAMALLRKEVPNIRLFVVGEGELRSQLKKKSEALGVDDIVQWLGFQSNPLDFISAFDVFCLSSREEGLGTSILDAMVLKVPVVATHVGGVPELIEHEKTGYLVPPSNAPVLAMVLQKALLRGDNNYQIVENALEKAKKLKAPFLEWSRYTPVYPQSYPHNPHFSGE
jgi:glycosyltransferase involved in cell wall biosynthesis